MKNLKDTISEKLSIDSIIPDKEEFPIDGSIGVIIKFLEDARFKRVQTHANWKESFKNYMNYGVKCFGVEKGAYTFIEFIDRSNPKFKNKLFYIKIAPNRRYNYDDKYNIFDNITTARVQADVRTVSKEEFLKELSKIL